MSGRALAITAGAVAALVFGAAVTKYAGDEVERRKQLEALAAPKPGQRRGFFECPRCGHKWNSYFAWVGEMQSCSKCKSWAVPGELRNIEASIDTSSVRVHKRERCTRCQKYDQWCYLV